MIAIYYFYFQGMTISQNGENTMKKDVRAYCIRSIFATLTAILVLATTLTFTACEEKGGGDTFTDPRDSKTYKTVKIGEQVWMAENLNFDAGYGSVCYGENYNVYMNETSEYVKLSDSEIQTNCKKYGRLYNIEAAKKACPKGWHLPNDKEWEILANFAGGANQAAKKLKSSSGWNGEENGSDAFGFVALPGGVIDYEYNGEFDRYEESFWGIGRVGCWWGDSKDEPMCARIYGDYNYAGDGNLANTGGRSGFCSIRCVQN